jgi:hypothetical protein
VTREDEPDRPARPAAFRFASVTASPLLLPQHHLLGAAHEARPRCKGACLVSSAVASEILTPHHTTPRRTARTLLKPPVCSDRPADRATERLKPWPFQEWRLRCDAGRIGSRAGECAVISLHVRILSSDHIHIQIYFR